MFKRQTLFVLGAGASAEANLPLGTGLAQVIGKKMDIRFERFNEQVGQGDMDLYMQVTQNMQRELKEFQNAAWLIRDGIGLAQSIDDFLDLHRSNPYVVRYGKAAIVKSVLEAERRSKLYFQNSSGIEVFDTGAVVGTWFVKFVHMLGRGVPRENVREIFEPVSFIVFNYDRCLEHFLAHALHKLYGIALPEATDIVSDSHIIHPYGVIEEKRPFGNTGGNHVVHSNVIKTYTEQTTDGDLLNAIHSEVERAECIVFLGFAFHSQNLLMLRPAKKMAPKPVFGTAFGMSDADVEVITNKITEFFSPPMSSKSQSQLIRLENKYRSADLFDNYARSLSGGD